MGRRAKKAPVSSAREENENFRHLLIGLSQKFGYFRCSPKQKRSNPHDSFCIGTNKEASKAGKALQVSFLCE